jgi:transcriptional regulator with PAS, ATPase and Fis domain
MAKKVFRKDLYYRIRGGWLHLPPLRERKEDIPLLAGKFLQDYDSSAKHQIIEEETLCLLMEYDYPGNVRELKSIIQSAVNLAQGKPISSDFLPAHLKKRKSISMCLPRPVSGDIEPLAQIEKSHIIRAYKFTDRNKSQTARLLGIGLNTLRRKLKSYGMME